MLYYSNQFFLVSGFIVIELSDIIIKKNGDSGGIVYTNTYDVVKVHKAGPETAVVANCMDRFICMEFKLIILSLMVLVSVSACTNKECKTNVDAGMKTEEAEVDTIIELKESRIEKSYYKLCEDAKLVLGELEYYLPMPENLSMTYENISSSKTFQYGNGFTLEKRINETWYAFPDILVNNQGFLLCPNEKAEVLADIRLFREDIDEGQYRVVCLINEIIESNDDTKPYDLSFPYEKVICEFEVINGKD